MSLRKRRKFNIPILMTTGVLGGGGLTAATQYANTILAMPNLVAYWPMTEDSGSTVVDASPNGYDGAYVGASLTVGGTPGPVQNTVAPAMGGTANAMTFNDAAFRTLATGFNGKQGHLSVWIKMAWSGTTLMYMLQFLANSSTGYVRIVKAAVSGQVNINYSHSTASAFKAVFPSAADNEWVNFQLSWQDDDYDAIDNNNGAFRVWVDNVEAGTATAVSGVFTPTTLAATNSSLLGSSLDIGTGFPTTGSFAHLVIFDDIVDAATRNALYNLPGGVAG